MTDIAIAVVEHEGRFLIGQRPPGVPLAGLWEFPGGKVEPGETPADAAVRECLEETGLATRILATHSTEEHRYDHGLVRLHFFSCHVVNNSLHPKPPFQWVDRASLQSYEFPAANGKLLKSLELIQG